jgi:hypothetical protein
MTAGSYLADVDFGIEIGGKGRLWEPALASMMSSSWISSRFFRCHREDIGTPIETAQQAMFPPGNARGRPTRQLY